jgi:acyl-CoA dehydrogenase
MELLDRYGSAAQEDRYLQPLLAGRIRASYCMTEPGVASSGDTNAYHPNSGLYIVMGKSNPEAPRHLQQSQILVDPRTLGITRLRSLPVFGYTDTPKGHAGRLRE